MGGKEPRRRNTAENKEKYMSIKYKQCKSRGHFCTDCVSSFSPLPRA
jgi:hypothetical protein